MPRQSLHREYNFAPHAAALNVFEGVDAAGEGITSEALCVSHSRSSSALMDAGDAK